MRWIKRLLAKKKTLAEVEQWIEDERAKRERSRDETLNTCKQSLEELLVSLERAAEELRSASLKNPNIPARAKHAIDGNRERLITLTKRLAHSLFAPQSEEDLAELDEALKTYRDNSARPLAILNQFFRDHVKALTNALATIEEQYNTVKAAFQSVKNIAALEQKLADLYAAQQQHKDAKAALHNLSKQRQTLDDKQTRLRREKEQLTEDPDYLAIKEDILNAAKTRQLAAQAITDLFAPLTAPLKKYAHAHRDEKLAAYAEDPLNTLVQDYSFSILGHVDSLITTITKGELDLDEQRSERAISALRTLDKELLGTLIHTFANAKKKEQDVHERIADKPVMRRYEQFAEELKVVQAELSDVDSQLSSVTLPDETEARSALQAELEQYNITLL